ncbi:MAG TPA: hypothetical protein VM144_11885 [Aestuariivirga sp.]|nr:hypothetical protein [Aestuariivirga sp.]
MGTWLRVIFLGLLAFGLGGCNLETKKPLFSDADAKLLLADYPNLAPYERDGGGWKKSADPLSIKPEAFHYLVKSGNSDMVIFFVPLEGPWWILQASEPSRSSTYVLIKAEPKELLIYSLECKTLQGSGKFGAEMEFAGSSCFIKEETDKMGLFKALIGSASEPSTKLVSEP